jgi:hypothetical protein
MMHTESYNEKHQIIQVAKNETTKFKKLKKYCNSSKQNLSGIILS